MGAFFEQPSEIRAGERPFDVELTTHLGRQDHLTGGAVPPPAPDPGDPLGFFELVHEVGVRPQRFGLDRHRLEPLPVVDLDADPDHPDEPACLVAHRATPCLHPMRAAIGPHHPVLEREVLPRLLGGEDLGDGARRGLRGGPGRGSPRRSARTRRAPARSTPPSRHPTATVSVSASHDHVPMRPASSARRRCSSPGRLSLDSGVMGEGPRSRWEPGAGSLAPAACGGKRRRPP